MNNSENKKRGLGALQIGVMILAVVALIGAIIPTLNPVAKQANQALTTNNARRIIAAMKLYAADHNGSYPDSAIPDARSSNEIFRLLIKGGMISDERIFGAKVSPFVPDNDIGEPPQYNKALEAGENHWAMVKGLSDSSRALSLVVLENPLTVSPLHWSNSPLHLTGKPIKGRAWRNGKIIVGFNDTSVQAMKLVPDPSNPSRLMLTTNPDWFPSSPSNPPVLDVLE